MTARTEKVEGALFVRKSGVPFWALARAFGGKHLHGSRKAGEQHAGHGPCDDAAWASDEGTTRSSTIDSVRSIRGSPPSPSALINQEAVVLLMLAHRG